MACSTRVPVTFTIEVADPDTILLSYDQIQVHRSTSGVGGPYVELTGTAQNPRIPLQSGVTEYEYEDDNGRETYYYKFRFYNSTTTAVSAFSAAQLGAVDPALDILSVDELLELYLFGLDLTDDRGDPMPATLFEHYIRSAVSALEHKLDIPIRRTEVELEMHDFYRDDYKNYMWMELNHFPVIEVTDIQMVLPGEQVVQDFPREWIHLDRMTGQVQMLPGTGSAGTIAMGLSGAWTPIFYGNNRFIPDVFRVQYVAGFGKASPGAYDRTPGLTGPISVPDPKLDRQQEVIKHAVGMVASYGPLNIAGDLIVGAGIASKSIGIDSLSQSVSTTSSATNAGFGARIQSYGKELRELLPELKRYYKGIKMRVV
jgi:hypothetical protein